MNGWTLRSSDPEMTLRLPAGAARTVGRSARAEFIVDAALVSRMHCRLRATDDALYVEDLESTNGVLVNGAKVEAAELRENDILTIGRVDFEVKRA